MRLTVFLVMLVMMVWGVVSSPVRPNEARSPAVYRQRRSAYAQDVKGRKAIQQHHNHKSSTMSSLELNLRKGEYICDNKICKLQPGEVPKGCDGRCQYRV